MTSQLPNDIQALIEAIPIELCMSLASSLDSATNWDMFLTQYPSLVRSSHIRSLVKRIIKTAQDENYSINELSLAIRVAAAVEQRHKQEPNLELVWTGPTFSPFVLRRTDEVILDVIQSAQKSLTLVSFALYHIERLTTALEYAARNGVEIRIFIESKNITQASIKQLYGDFLSGYITFFAWSPDQRTNSSIGKQGLLHAKTAIADRKQLLISSANLTEHAMSLNIELGVLITGGVLPLRVNQLFDQLVEREIFARFSTS